MSWRYVMYVGANDIMRCCVCGILCEGFVSPISLHLGAPEWCLRHWEEQKDLLMLTYLTTGEVE